MYAREKGSIMFLELLRCFQAGVLLLTYNELTYHINVEYTLKFPPQFDLLVLLVSVSFPETMNLLSFHYDTSSVHYMSNIHYDMSSVHCDMSSVHYDTLAHSYTVWYSVSNCYHIFLIGSDKISAETAKVARFKILLNTAVHTFKSYPI